MTNTGATTDNKRSRNPKPAVLMNDLTHAVKKCEEFDQQGHNRIQSQFSTFQAPESKNKLIGKRKKLQNM
jgi:hypothetical protein